MGLEFAIEELCSTGWSPLDTSGCEADAQGRWMPTLDRIRREFEAEGYTLEVRHVQLFDCYRAEWSDRAGQPAGGVVGQSDREAALFALATLRRASLGV